MAGKDERDLPGTWRSGASPGACGVEIARAEAPQLVRHRGTVDCDEDHATLEGRTEALCAGADVAEPGCGVAFQQRGVRVRERGQRFWRASRKHECVRSLDIGLVRRRNAPG